MGSSVRSLARIDDEIEQESGTTWISMLFVRWENDEEEEEADWRGEFEKLRNSSDRNSTVLLIDVTYVTCIHSSIS